MSKRRRELAPFRRPIAAASTYQEDTSLEEGEMPERERKHLIYQNVHLAFQDHTIIVFPFLMSFSIKSWKTTLGTKREDKTF